MIVRTVLVACACVVASGAPRARADDPAATVEGVPIVLGDDVVADGGEAVLVPTEDLPELPLVDAPGIQPPAAEIVTEAYPAGALPTACTDCPGERVAYTTFDALFLDRPNTAGPLAVQSWFTDDPGAPVISAGDVRYPMIPGARVFQGWRYDDTWGWEAGYLGAWSMHADALATSPDAAIALPGQLGLEAGGGFDAATAIRPVVNGNLNSFEINVFTTRVHDGCRRHDPLPWRRVGMIPTADWILGVRWAGLDEVGTLDVTTLADSVPTPPLFRTTTYRVTSSSHMVGPQIGHRRRLDWGDWAVEGWAKAALTASLLTQSQSAVVRPFDLDEVRGPRSGSRAGVGMIGDVNATLVRRFGDHWGLRAGYTLLWFTGVAPAANQWDFSLDPAAGTGVVVDTVFLHGASLGVEATW